MFLELPGNYENEENRLVGVLRRVARRKNNSSFSVWLKIWQ